MTAREEMDLLAENLESTMRRLKSNQLYLENLRATSTRFKTEEKINLARSVEALDTAILCTGLVQQGVMETVQLMVKHNV